jgi:HSP20 family protein
MANLSIRRGGRREPLAGARDPWSAMDPFRLIRDLVGGDLFAGTVPAMAEAFAPELELKETKEPGQKKEEGAGERAAAQPAGKKAA